VRLLVLGANGQLGSDLARLAGEGPWVLRAATRDDADVTDAGAVATLVASVRPDVVMNTTAWTDLPGCERDPGRAFAVNAIGALNVARAAAEHDATLLHVSTDYVFDGAKNAPYVEGDPRRALNVYGASKLAGEDLVRQAHPAAAIVRVAGLYGVAGASGKGGNFVETMLRLAREGRPLKVIADQVTCPTNTEDVARALLALAASPPRGEVHLAPGDACSWHDFARAIFELCGLEPALEPTTAAAYGGPVVRPAFSALASNHHAPLPPWRDGLARYLAAKEHLP
jgi:dTDP-4-dehydrorhamnose reductase